MAKFYLRQNIFSSGCAAARIHHYYRHRCYDPSNLSLNEQYTSVAGCWLLGFWNRIIHLYQSLPLGQAK